MVRMERQDPQQEGTGRPEGAPGELPQQQNALQGTIGCNGY